MTDDVFALATREYDAEMDAQLDALARSLSNRELAQEHTIGLLLTARLEQLDRRDRTLAALRVQSAD